MRNSGKTFSLFSQHEPPPQPRTTEPVAARADSTLTASTRNSKLLWLCVHLPRLSLSACADQSQGPLAVVDGQGASRVICACNAQAAQLGVRAGLGLNAAMAIAPELYTVSRKPHDEQRQLRQLAVWCQRFTALVCVEPPCTLLLEVRGSLRLFGGVQALCDQVVTGLERLGHAPVLACAPTPLGALWLARGGLQNTVVIAAADTLAGHVGSLPLKCTGWPDKVLATLNGMGVREVRDCLRLPRDGFARRIGKARLHDLDRAVGRAPDPRTGFILPDRFSGGYELPLEVEQLGHLSAAIQQLVRELSDFLRVRFGAVQQLTLGLYHNDVPATRVTVGLVRPGCDWRHLWGLLEERLERVTLQAPVIALTLRSGTVVDVAGDDGDLFGKPGAGAGNWPRLIESLNARLGARSVTGISTTPEHRPELAWRAVAPGEGNGQPVDNARPSWMLEVPSRLRTHEDRPWFEGALQLETGPERIETGWWDGADVARDYYVARNVAGMRLWIYRERRQPRQWYLHGMFG